MYEPLIDDFTAKFAQFVNSKDPNEEYTVLDLQNCALGQFISKKGYKGRSTRFETKDGLVSQQYPLDLYDVVCGFNVEEPTMYIGMDTHTFGDLKKRMIRY